MKLETAIRDGRLMVDEAFIDHQNIEWYQAPKVCRDAAVAHALMRAMDEVKPTAFTNQIGAVNRRASELLREWGFDSGEVE